MRRGDYFAAVTMLDEHRISLLSKLAEEDKPLFGGEKKRVKEELALVNHQLSIALEIVGNEKMADKRGSQALRYFEGPNRLAFAILLRDTGMRMLRRRQLDEAEPLIQQAIEMIQVLREPVEGVPKKRIEMDYWVAQSYLAQIMIARGETRAGVALLCLVDEQLQKTSKRYRELDNLIVLISNVGPIEQRRLALRAIKINGAEVHNPYKRVWLLAVLAYGGTPIPRFAKRYLR